MIYYTSDLHFNHTKIIELACRPFKDIDDMNNSLIKNYNSVITDRDTVYILGDLGFNDVFPFVKQLNGNKFWITGNHDKKMPRKKEVKELFNDTFPYCEIRDYGRHVVLFHYPILEWNGFFKDWYHLYGHIHSPEPFRHKNCFNVSVDLNNYMPVTLDQLIKRRENNV